MGRFVFITVFALIFSGLLAWNIPLGFILSKSGLRQQGFNWSQAEGTIWSGRINGISIRGQPFGDAVIKFRPFDLISGFVGYDVQWGGAGGRGSGRLALRSGQIEATGLRLEQQIAGLEGLASNVRAIGGVIRFDGGSVLLRDGKCTNAAGAASTDALTRIAALYGREFPLLSGKLSCVSGEIGLQLAGISVAGDQISVSLSAAGNGRSRFTAQAMTKDSQIALLLASSGFVSEAGEWVYRYENETVGTDEP